MSDVMGIIYTSTEGHNLRDLTASRAVAALPIGGRYRVIDFILSSMINSDIRNVGVIMQSNYHSLMDHLGSGREWDLHTRVDGLRILPPYLTMENGGTYQGILDALHTNMSYLRRSRQEFVVIASGMTLMNGSLDDIVREHIRTGADITVAYTRDQSSMLAAPSTGTKHAYLNLDDEQRLIGLEINPNAPEFRNLGIEVYVVRRKLLIYLVEQAVAQGMHLMMGDLLRSRMQDGSLDIRGYEYKGFVRRIETVEGYFRMNLDLLEPEKRAAVFGEYPVFTKTRDEAPAKYMDGSSCVNSLVGDGCVIEGTVENSVLFRGVHIGRGAVVRNCVLFQDSEIMDGAELENVIFDKAVTIRRKGRLVGQPLFPIVVGKNTTL